MQEPEISKLMLAALKLVRYNLIFRIKIIDLIGQKGHADDIRQATRAIHVKAVATITNWIKYWSHKPILEKFDAFNAIITYLASISQNETDALETLQALKQSMGNETGAIFDEALQAHINLKRQTEGLQNSLNTAKQKIDMYAQSQKPNLLDADLNKKRTELIENLKQNITGPKL
jgi:hypothetical protein